MNSCNNLESEIRTRDREVQLKSKFEKRNIFPKKEIFASKPRCDNHFEQLEINPSLRVHDP